MTKDFFVEEDLIRRKKIPVLIIDHEWKALFEKNMTKPMKKIAQELNEKLSDEKKATVQLKVYKKLKRQLREKILLLSDEVNTKEKENSIMKLEETKKQILEINKQMDELEYQLEILPREIEKLNYLLLVETIEMAYSDIKEGNAIIPGLADEIIHLRQQLREKWEKKLALEKKSESLYSYLHNTLGHEETNKMDKHFL